ncbi:kinase [Nocardia macrotermitis]|uniref:Guanylate kinase n=1 Tax=Nocardia macrotermitis TaxID=2585198 RepID=A0A7K0D326_9NOCA|nr:kinase [Nocardia macrotermitis]MQY19344.1 hypothetical protein [Nocardia macrotermitis]
MSAAVILYGPPTSGKDTVTAALSTADSAYVLFRRLKVGAGRTATYRMTTAEHVAELAAAGDIIWKNERYNAVYIVDRPELVNIVAAQRVPILHLGQPEAISAVCAAMPEINWTVVELWCPRDVAERRIRDRDTGDVAERLTAWDSTVRLPADLAELSIDTAVHSPTEAAEQIRKVVAL